MDDAAVRRLDEQLRPFQRTAWLPELIDEDGDAVASKLSGAPALASAEEWPQCGNCHRPMQLFVQLNAGDLPDDAAAKLDGGLLQLFYCTSGEPLCEAECEAYFPHGKSTLVRLLAPNVLTSVRADATIPPGMFPAKRIVAWTPTRDLPHWEELGDLGVVLGEEELDALAERDFPRSGEKLLGWPAWIQGVEYPSCRSCGRRMELLFQIDSERSLPYMFGDAGIGHITQCPEHLGELAFGWACG